MSAMKLSWMSVVVVLLASPALVRGQEAVLSGVVTDSTGGVLPGVTITAVHVASGNNFVSVTDERGEYRLPVRTGAFKITAELSGFATVTRDLDLLVGQEARITLQMVPSTVQETITVTGEAPLLDRTQSTLGGNIDRRQMESLPVNGRNWMGLALLAPGSKQTQVGDSPIGQRDLGQYQIVMDGQDITQTISTTGVGQTKISRDAIQEFEFISNRFDVAFGRSGGVIVNAITKSGTNTFAGTASGYFRDDTFNAADFVVGRVLPYSDQQYSGTFGGPIRQNVAHFFAYYERERQPQTFAFTSPFPAFNIAPVTVTNATTTAGGRFDLQFSANTRLMTRGNRGNYYVPVSVSGANHPSTAGFQRRTSGQVFGSLTHVVNNRTVNEITGGWHRFRDHSAASFDLPEHFPLINLLGYSIGKGNAVPRNIRQDNYSIRDNLTRSLSGGGTHELKAGGEFIVMNVGLAPLCNFCDPTIDAIGGPIPADIESLFPVWNDPSTWNLAALSPIVTRYAQAIGNFNFKDPRRMASVWAQDSWRLANSLTLNLGLRSDFCTGCFADDLEFPPRRLKQNSEIQKWAVAPRVGFVYSLPDQRTVIRGGVGRFFSAVTDVFTHTSTANAQTIAVDVPNDGRPNFAADPFNLGGGGSIPTLGEVVASGRRREYNYWIVGPDMRVPYTWQSSVGFERQLAEGMAVQADYVRNDGRQLITMGNANLSCDPLTGFNYPFTDISRRPYPNYGVLPEVSNLGKSTYNGLQTAVTKRFSDGWQLSATYTLSKARDNAPGMSLGYPDNSCDPLSEWASSEGDQRHRAVINGIWALPYRFELSGLYFYGSGERYANNYGGDLRNTGNRSAGRLRPDGTVVPRNSFVGRPLHRVDMRVQRRFPLAGSATVDGILEVFNVFNHENYGSYVLNQANRNYGRPVQNINVAFAPRMLQLGFRVAF